MYDGGIGVLYSSDDGNGNLGRVCFAQSNRDLRNGFARFLVCFSRGADCRAAGWMERLSLVSSLGA